MAEKSNRIEKEIVGEMLEEAAIEFNAQVIESMRRMDTAIPHMIFQEKHTGGHHIPMVLESED